MRQGEQRVPSWLGSVPLYAGLLTGMVLSRLGVLDPVAHAVGRWLGFGDRAPHSGGIPDRPPTAAADPATHPSPSGGVPDDVRAPATPGGHKSARVR
jgi:hypothetical protein